MFDSTWIIKRKVRKYRNILDEILDLKDIENKDLFLNPGVSDLFNPFLMNDMDTAVDRILEAVENEQKICIYGDYDADGLTSSALLGRFLKSIDANIDIFIPDRFDDGYGLSIECLKNIVNAGTKLVITTDCGMNSVNEALFLKENEVDLIITDHHLSLGELPYARAVICSTRDDNNYPYLYLSGAGVTYKLVSALSETLGIDEIDSNLTALAAVGTAADIVPMDGENRILVQMGMKAIKSGANTGIDALLENSGVKKENINSYILGFVIGPRINAAGRLGKAEKALELLMTDDFIRSRELADQLSKLNNDRKKEQNRIHDLVLEDIKRNPMILDAPVIISGGETYNKGVVGIVASKISETYQKPAIILSYSNGIAEGSGRGRSGFSLIDALEHCRGVLLKFGGHRSAAGLSLKTAAVDELRAKITEYTLKTDYKAEQSNITEVCFEVSEENLDINSVKSLNKLEPFGNGNTQPVFSLKNAVLAEYRKIGAEGKHLSLSLRSGGSYFKAVCFNSSFYEPFLIFGEKYDIAFTLKINEFKDRKNVQLMIKDMRFTPDSGISDNFMIVRILVNMIKYEKAEFADKTRKELAYSLYESGMPYSATKLLANEDIFSINRNDIKYIFNKLKNSEKGYSFRLNEKSDRLSFEKQCIAVEILDELGILKLTPGGMYKYKVREPYSHQKGKLEESAVYRVFSREEG